MLEIDIWPSARDFISSLSGKQARQIASRIKRLADTPFSPQSKLLEGYAPLRRLKAGDYRIVYFVEGNVLKIPIVERRGDDAVYRRLKRLFG